MENLVIARNQTYTNSESFMMTLFMPKWIIKYCECLFNLQNPFHEFPYIIISLCTVLTWQGGVESRVQKLSWRRVLRKYKMYQVSWPQTLRRLCLAEPLAKWKLHHVSVVSKRVTFFHVPAFYCKWLQELKKIMHRIWSALTSVRLTGAVLRPASSTRNKRPPNSEIIFMN